MDNPAIEYEEVDEYKVESVEKPNPIQHHVNNKKHKLNWGTYERGYETIKDCENLILRNRY